MVLAAIEAQKDIMLAQLVALLRHEHGGSFAISTVHRHLVRHRITLKKPRTPPSRTGRTWRAGDRPGSTRSLTSIPHAWYSSTRREGPPRWPGCGAEHCVANAAEQPCRTGTGKLTA